LSVNLSTLRLRSGEFVSQNRPVGGVGSVTLGACHARLRLKIVGQRSLPQVGLTKGSLIKNRNVCCIRSALSCWAREIYRKLARKPDKNALTSVHHWTQVVKRKLLSTRNGEKC